MGELKSLLRPDVFDDANDYDFLRPEQLNHVQKMQLASNIDIRDVFEDGNLAKLKDFPELEKSVKKLWSTPPITLF